MPNLRNAIIGFAFGYSNDTIAPFLNSLKEINYSDDLILYVNNKSKIKCGNYTFKIILVYPEKEFPWHIRLNRIVSKFSKALGFHNFWRKHNFKKALLAISQNKKLSNWVYIFFYTNYYFATIRFCLYYNYFLDNKYDRVFFTDITDVVFQKNVFDYTIPQKLSIFEENINIPILKQHNNRDWIEDLYGLEVLEVIKNKTIFCSGTILANYNSAIQFLADYIIQLIKIERDKIFITSIMGLDQGIYNYMIHYEKYEYMERVENGSVVFTIGIQPGKDIIIKDNNIVFLEKPDDVPAVVHQYNRHKNLIKFVKDKYNCSLTKYH